MKKTKTFQFQELTQVLTGLQLISSFVIYSDLKLNFAPLQSQLYNTNIEKSLW